MADTDTPVVQDSAKKKSGKKIDVYNRGSRTYTSPSGVHLQGGQTTQLDEDEGKSLLKAYPADLISPDALRSAPASQGDNDRKKEIERLQGIVKDLEGKLSESVQEATGLKAKQTDDPLKGAFHLLGELLTSETHKVVLEADEGLRTSVTMFHAFLDEHFKKNPSAQ